MHKSSTSFTNKSKSPAFSKICSSFPFNMRTSQKWRTSLSFSKNSNCNMGSKWIAPIFHRSLTLSTLSALNLFVAWIKVFKYLSFNATMTQLSQTLTSVSDTVALSINVLRLTAASSEFSGRPRPRRFCGHVFHHIFGIHAVGLPPLWDTGILRKYSNTVQGIHTCTGWLCRIQHRKWRETKLQPSCCLGLALLGYSLVSHHFRC